MEIRSTDSRNPRDHVENIRRMLREVADHAREDVAKVDDKAAQALFETTAETLDGLGKAYEHYAQGTEQAWRQPAIDRSHRR